MEHHQGRVRVQNLEDPIHNENLRLLWILKDKFRDEPFLTGQLSSRLSPESLAVLRQITGHRDGEEFNERKAGKYFSRLADRWFEGIRLIRTGKNQGGRIEWRIEAKLDDSHFRVMEEPL